MTTHAAMPLQDSARPRRADAALIALWAAALALGWWQTVAYEFDAADPHDVHYAKTWPGDSSLKRVAGRSTLLVFLHPKCPCSRATLHELDRLVAALDNAGAARPDVQFIATVPADADQTWWNTKTIDHGNQIAPGRLTIDRAGREAALFGVTTSGTLLWFDPAGNRRFGGGITVSRGHEGHSAGADSLLQLIARRADAIPAEMPVFGCRLCLPKVERQNSDRAPGGLPAVSALGHVTTPLSN